MSSVNWGFSEQKKNNNKQSFRLNIYNKYEKNDVMYTSYKNGKICWIKVLCEYQQI